MAKPKKRKPVPEVLWKVFGNRARTLADTVLALTPPASAGCSCKGRRCISCRGDQAMSFLVRPTDSLEYRRLLEGWYVVVAETAPNIPIFDPHRRWSQLELVRRSIETMLSEQPSSSNLLCYGYDKDIRSSDVVNALTSSKWTVLLRRVGDAMMVYLLKYTSLFLPLPRKKYHQIVGCPVSNLRHEFSKPMPEPNPQHHPLATNVSKKRRRVEGVESIPRKQQLRTYDVGSEPYSNSTKFIEGNGSRCISTKLSQKECEENLKENTTVSQKRKQRHRWQRQRKRRQLVVEEDPSLISCRGNDCNSDRLKENTTVSQKRTRRHRWQRQKKPRQLVVEDPSLIQCRGNDCNSDTLLLCASSSRSDQSNISLCFCCLVLQNEPKMEKNAEIDRRNMFYKLENSTSMLPRKHILHSLRPNGPGASMLFNNVFGTFSIRNNDEAIPFSQCKNSSHSNSNCLYHTLTKLLQRLISESQSCQYLRLLHKHCSIRSSYQDASTGRGIELKGTDSGPNLATSKEEVAQSDGKFSHAAKTENCKMASEASTDQIEPIRCCPKKDVVSFIWAICRRIVPSSLLGEPFNWRVLRRNISKFIHLGRYEKFSLRECICELKISKFPLFSNKHTGCREPGVTDIARHAVLECWILWFFAHLVSPLVQANFYVTETEHEKQEVQYYPKLSWLKMLEEAKCMKDDRYRLLDHASALKILGSRPFGFSRARLRPKQNGFRMLTNLRAPSRMPVKPPYFKLPSNQKLRGRSSCVHQYQGKCRFFKSVNSVLNDLHVVLKGLRTKEPEKLGSSVFDYNDVYRKLVPFLFLLRKRSTSVPNTFMVVADVSKAFDSVHQNKLLSVMKDVIVDKEFTLEKLTHVTCTKYLKVNQHHILAHQDIVTASASIRSWSHSHSSNSIVVKKEFGRKLMKEDINSILKEHITRNVVQLGNNFYLQRVGIPQGSILSSLLCSFYYGHMEKNVLLPFLEKANREFSGTTQDHPGCDYLLLRFIDDFLFISTSEKQASMFFSRLERGVRDYNCCMNEEKYGLNFIMNKGQGCRSNKIHVGKDGISFLLWSGLLVNCTTLEIQADYTRYLNTHLSSTLTVIAQGKVGRHLKAKLRNYLRPKCHPIFYDSNINSPGVVRLNIYQVFLLCAMKFISYISNLSVFPAFPPKFCINAIYSSLRYMARLIKRKMHSFKIEPAFRPKYDVKNKEIRWLGLYAYSRVVNKKQSRYRDLLRLLRIKLKAYGDVENMPRNLKYAVDDAHSSLLWSIKY